MKYSKLQLGGPTPGPVTETSIRVVKESLDFQEFHQQVKLNYAAARPTRTRRERRLLGGMADAHYVSQLEFWRLREFARDFDRNDVIVGQMVDRAIDNIFGPGLQAEPQTGDRVLNLEMAEWFNEEWAADPEQCDVAGRHDFFMMQRLAHRTTLVDGDMFTVLGPRQNPGAIAMYEGDNVAGGSLGENNVVHGVIMDDITGRPTDYLFLKGPINRKFRRVSQPISSTSDMLVRIPRFDKFGNLQVLHVYDPKRMSQSRGITAFKAIFDSLAMFEDTNFAKLVQQQVVSCIAAFLVREQDHVLGPRVGAQSQALTSETIEKLSPGAILRLKPGEKMMPFSPAVPNSEWFEHVKLILRLIGINIGLPLEVSLMDTSDTTFHGYRGALQQARMGFRCVQRWFPAKFQSEVYKFKARQFLGRDRVERNPKLLRHTWRLPGWPYVDPAKDSQADAQRLQNGLASPRRIQAERGYTWNHTVDEIVEDYGMLIEKALEKAKELNEQFPDAQVTWREVANLAMPQGVYSQASLIPEPPAEPEPSEEDEDEEDAKLAKLLEMQLADSRERMSTMLNHNENVVREVIQSNNERSNLMAQVLLREAERPAPNITLNIPDRETRIEAPVTVNVPERNVELKVEQPNVEVHVPEREVNVHVEGPTINAPQKSNLSKILKVTKRNSDGTIAEAEVQ